MVVSDGLYVERKEKKYILDANQFAALLRAIGDRLEDDEYPFSQVQSLYYDTPERTMINRSLAQPAYKEKLRLRAYGPVDPRDAVYVELKKKLKGVVYKRRFPLGAQEAQLYLAGMPYEQAARRSLVRGIELPQAFSWETLQTVAEFDVCRERYRNLEPAMMVLVNRLAKRTNDGSDVRVTFDHAACWRDSNLQLGVDLKGTPLLDSGAVIMEVKCRNAYPMWLARAFSSLRIYPQSCSKVGRAYEMQHGRPDVRSSMRQKTIAVEWDCVRNDSKQHRGLSVVPRVAVLA